jgi:hypothetical protein
LLFGFLNCHHLSVILKNCPRFSRRNGLFKKKRIPLFARFLFIFLQISSLLSFRNSIFFLLSNTIYNAKLSKKTPITLYMVFVLSFILEFIGLFVTLFRSFSLTNINIPFIENSTILKRFFVFFVSFLTRNITHFIFHFIKLSQQKGENTALLGSNRWRIEG